MGRFKRFLEIAGFHITTEFEKKRIDALNQKLKDGDLRINRRGCVEVTGQGLSKLISHEKEQTPDIS